MKQIKCNDYKCELFVHDLPTDKVTAVADMTHKEWDEVKKKIAWQRMEAAANCVGCDIKPLRT